MKIAVLRANALGDFIFILPALQALKETFRDSEIVLLGKPWHKSYLSARPGPVDRVVIVPPYPGVSEPEGYIPDEDVLEQFFLEMKRENFDLAFQLHGGGKNSNPFILRLGARKTVGLKTPDAVPLDMNISYVYYFSEILRYLEVVRLVGVLPTTIEPRISSTMQDLYEASKVLQNHQNKPVAVVHPGATDCRRRWPAARFATVADYLVKEGYHVCITGTSVEEETVEEVIRLLEYPDRVQNCCNRLSLSGLTGLLEKAALLVANDTGPLHLARALGTPTVGIFWCGNSVTGISMNSHLHRTHISWNFCCPMCGLSSRELKTKDSNCKHDASFLIDVPTDEVTGSIKELDSLIKERAHPLENKQAAYPQKNESLGIDSHL